jgi:hypothetical protein
MLFNWRSTTNNSGAKPNVTSSGGSNSANSKRSGSSSVQFDAVYGGAFAGALGFLYTEPFVSWLAYFEDYSSFSANLDSYSLSVQDAASVIGSVFYSLEEVTPANVTANSFFLNSLSWTVTPVQQASNDTLEWVTFTGTSGTFPGSINVTFIVSKVIGVLFDSNGPVITPKSHETIVSIAYTGYLNATNHLRLNGYVGHAASVTNVVVNVTTHTISNGNGTTEVYFQVAGTHEANGQTQNTQVSISTVANAYTSLKVISKYLHDILSWSSFSSNQIYVHQVTLDFTPGATSIVFDPTVGNQQPSSASVVSSGSGTGTTPTGTTTTAPGNKSAASGLSVAYTSVAMLVSVALLFASAF